MEITQELDRELAKLDSIDEHMPQFQQRFNRDVPGSADALKRLNEERRTSMFELRRLRDNYAASHQGADRSSDDLLKRANERLAGVPPIRKEIRATGTFTSPTIGLADAVEPVEETVVDPVQYQRDLDILEAMRNYKGRMTRKGLPHLGTLTRIGKISPGVTDEECGRLWKVNQI